jgi:hypothetical protein
VGITFKKAGNLIIRAKGPTRELTMNSFVNWGGGVLLNSFDVDTLCDAKINNHPSTLSLVFFSPSYPLFQWHPQSNEILLNLSMKC